MPEDTPRRECRHEMPIFEVDGQQVYTCTEPHFQAGTRVSTNCADTSIMSPAEASERANARYAAILARMNAPQPQATIVPIPSTDRMLDPGRRWHPRAGRIPTIAYGHWAVQTEAIAS